MFTFRTGENRETIKPIFIRKWLLCASLAPDPPVRLPWKRALRGSAFVSLSGMSHWRNLWIQSNQRLPEGLKAKSESQWCGRDQEDRGWHVATFAFNLTDDFEVCAARMCQFHFLLFVLVSVRVAFQVSSCHPDSVSPWLRLNSPSSRLLLLAGHCHLYFSAMRKWYQNK